MTTLNNWERVSSLTWKFQQELWIQRHKKQKTIETESNPGLHHQANLKNIHHTISIAPAHETNVLTTADSCSDSLYQLLLENLFALSRQGEGASPPFWLLLSAPALSQPSVSSSQSPCQQDFTLWPRGTAKHSPSLSCRHTHQQHTKTHKSFKNIHLHLCVRQLHNHPHNFIYEVVESFNKSLKYVVR